MREIKSRTFFCPKQGVSVILIEHTRCEPGCDAVCGVLSCSHQEMCVLEEDGREVGVYPWASCPACRRRGERESPED